MARFEINGIDALIDDLADLENLPDELIADMLFAEAEIVGREQSATGRAMGVVETGKTVESITYEKKLKTTSSGKAVYVYPRGNRPNGKTTKRNAEVAFINEYGKRGQPARPFIRTANEKASDEAIAAAEKVYNAYLDSKNL